ncbi:MAG: hypothetical protein KTR28_08710 [Micavibrio sp.]|nr:hypothetical protein [Micavibrio sp.]
MLRWISFLFVVFVLVSCVSGRTIKDEQVRDFQVGVTRYEEVLEALGKPSSRTVDSQGDVYLHYKRAVYTIKPESFLPIVGEHVGGMNSSSKSTVVVFSPDGVMKDVVGQNVKSDAAMAH